MSVVTFYLFLPETKNRTLEEIDAFFVQSKNALQPVKVAKAMPEGIAQDFGEGDVKKSAFANEVEKV